MSNTDKKLYISINESDITTALKESTTSLSGTSIAFTKLNKYSLCVELFEYDYTTGVFTPIKLSATETLVAAMRNAEDDTEVGEISAFTETDTGTPAVAENFIIQCANVGAESDVYITLTLPDGTKKVIWFDVAQADGGDRLSPATMTKGGIFDTHEAIEVEATLAGEVVTNLASALSGIDGVTATADVTEHRVSVAFDTAGAIAERPRVGSSSTKYGSDAGNFNIHSTQFGKDAVAKAVYKATLDASGTGWDFGSSDSFTCYLTFEIQDTGGIARTIARKLITCERNFVS